MPKEPKTKNLYELLGVEKTAKVEDISRAYRRLALQYHPDRNPDGAEQFKELARAHEILSDPTRRSMYDLTGTTGEPNSEVSDEARTRQRSAELGEEIRAFYATYRGSDDEKEDIVASYLAAKGDFESLVFEHLLFDNQPGEIERLRGVIADLIASGRLEATKKWARTGASDKACAKYEKEMQAERKAAKAELAKMGLGGANSLQMILANRAKEQELYGGTTAEAGVVFTTNGAPQPCRVAVARADAPVGIDHRA